MVNCFYDFAVIFKRLNHEKQKTINDPVIYYDNNIYDRFQPYRAIKKANSL